MNETLKEKLNKVKLGIVESNADPTYTGRLKVRIPGLNDNIETANLPWCNYAGSASSSGQLAIPKVGQLVKLQLAQNDVNNIEWTSVAGINDSLSWELAADYEGSQSLMYDPEYDVSLKFQPNSGLLLYFKGSYIQITPDNNITLMYKDETAGVSIQLTDGKIFIQGTDQINISSGNEVNIEGKTITLNADSQIRIKGNSPNNCAVNANELITLLQTLALQIDSKLGASTSNMASATVSGSKEKIMNQSIAYI